jgi:hypothetical protein
LKAKFSFNRRRSGTGVSPVSFKFEETPPLQKNTGETPVPLVEHFQMLNGNLY